MGVQGLWKLLESTGRPVSLESLDSKVLAVDVSLWLHQAVRGMRDERGNVVANAHLHVLFNRVCKLLFYRIKPIFVFDGDVPDIKRQTMVARRQKREIAAGMSKRTSEKIIKNYLQSHALQVVMGEASGSRDNAAPKLHKLPAEPDMFELLPQDPSVLLQDSWSDSDSDSDAVRRDDHFDRFQNLDDVDIDSESFRSLPPEMQHEMLVEMKENKKRNSWKTLDQLPKKSRDFSNYQVMKLLQKGKMTKRIGVLREEMRERNVGAVVSMLDVEGSRAHAHAVDGGRVMSEDAHHYLLLKRSSSKMEADSSKTAGEEAGEMVEDVSHRVETADSPGSDRCQQGVQTSDDVGVLHTPSHVPQVTDVISIDDDAQWIVGSSHVAESAHSAGTLANSRGTFTDSDSTRQISPLPKELSSLTGLCESGTELGQDKDTTDSGGDYREVSPSLHVEAQGLPTAMAAVDNEASRKKSEAMEEQFRRAADIAKDLAQESSPKESPDITAIGTEDRYLAVIATSKQETASASAETDVAKEAAKEGEMDADDTSSSGDDFVEVPAPSVAQAIAEGLFPASAFIPSAGIGEVTNLLPSPIYHADITTRELPEPRSRASQERVCVETEALATGADEGGRTRNEVEPDDKDIGGDFEEEIQEDIEAEMERRREDATMEWQAMDVEDAPHLQENLEVQRQMLQAERGKQERVAASITDMMYSESKELLQLFGVPYLESPQEAEAQCAHLDQTGQTQGTITDDSDVWPFGGCTVYKNFFAKGKDIECFRSADVEKRLVLDRCKLITLAMLLGSDYTEGIKGVGGVTAMEVLTQFPGQGLDLLKSLKSWWDATREQLMPPVESPIKAKLRKLSVPASFPSQHVFDAYWSPVVDESAEDFSWQSPDLGLLREFAKDKLGWTRTKTDEILLPVMKKLNERVRQVKITSFLQSERCDLRKVTSKRLQRVLRHLRDPPAAEEDEGRKKMRKGTKGASGRLGKTGTVTKTKKRKQDGDCGAETVDARSDAVPIASGNCRDGEDAAVHRSNLSTVDGEDTVTQSPSIEVYLAPKRVKSPIDDADSPSAIITRKCLRTIEKIPDYNEEKQTLLDEFLEMEEAVARKTEGVIYTRTSTTGPSDNRVIDEPVVSSVRTESSIADTKSVAGTVEPSAMKGESFGLREGLVTRGRGQGVRGQGRKGKGQAGVKGKGKLAVGGVQSRGPKLSESSSSDSDE